MSEGQPECASVRNDHGETARMIRVCDEEGRRTRYVAVRTVLRTVTAGTRRRGRLKTKWKDAYQRDTRIIGVRAAEAMDRATRRRKLLTIAATPEDGRSRRKIRRGGRGRTRRVSSTTTLTITITIDMIIYVYLLR